MSIEPGSNTSFLSVGLDIGTTTTHLVISRLSVGAGEDPFGRHHLLDKEIVHRSAIYMTPMYGGPGETQEIDCDAIHRIVTSEYAAAGVRAEDILTGAVIVTGETALKHNADAVVQRLAGESSSFAAAVAGANQESVLAGRGSGAAEYSRRRHCCVVNADIGGGTTNLAWFIQGEPAAAAAIRVGGRHLVKAAHGDGYDVVSQTARQLVGRDTADAVAAARWISTCVESCERALAGDFEAIPSALIVTCPGCTPPRPDAIFFSGGVAELMAGLQQGQTVDENRFGDTGWMLARALVDSPRLAPCDVIYPSEPIRATVIGAGQFSLMLSGETLWVDDALLPLRNLPLLRLPRKLRDSPDVDALARIIQHEQHLHSIASDRTIAIALPELREADWDTVVSFAIQLAAAARQVRLPAPWVFTMRDNFGHLLGRTVAEQAPDQPLIVVDEIDTAQADFLDIGRPVKQFRTLIPVVAKSLIFEQ